MDEKMTRFILVAVKLKRFKIKNDIFIMVMGVQYHTGTKPDSLDDIAFSRGIGSI